MTCYECSSRPLCASALNPNNACVLEAYNGMEIEELEENDGI